MCALSCSRALVPTGPGYDVPLVPPLVGPGNSISTCTPTDLMSEFRKFDLMISKTRCVEFHHILDFCLFNGYAFGILDKS